MRPSGALGGTADRRNRSLPTTYAALTALVGSLCAMAWVFRWLQDDAYITFRYADHLATGYGPVWNVGQAVEGYSNFLWMLILAGAQILGIDPETTSQVIGVHCFAGSLLMVFWLGRRLLPNDGWALIATFLVGTNYSFLMYATGGLETQLMAMLTLAVLSLSVAIVDGWHMTSRRALALSLCAGLAVMTRPDAPIVIAVAFACAGRVALGQRDRVAVALSLLAPAALLVLPWIYWKYQFYGELLPNTFHAKASNRTSLTLVRGLVYTAWLFISYWWLPVIIAIAWKSPRRISWPRRKVAPLLVYAVLWLSYIVWVGGDFMEMRLMVSVIPVILLLMLTAMAAKQASPRWVGLAVVVFCSGSFVHGLFFKEYVRPVGIGSIPRLSAYVSHDQPANWTAMGIRLAEDLGPMGGATLAVCPAGAIPFFARQRTIDVLGLNDEWVARNGFIRRKCTVCQAHIRLATIDYLNGQEVNLVIGHPQLVPWEEPLQDPWAVVRSMFMEENLDYENVPGTAALVRVPLENGQSLAALYLEPTPRVEALLSTGRWRGQALQASFTEASPTE